MLIQLFQYNTQRMFEADCSEVPNSINKGFGVEFRRQFVVIGKDHPRENDSLLMESQRLASASEGT